MDFPPTKLDYHVDMFSLQSQSRFLSVYKAQDGRITVILDSTVFHPQGGGQPADIGFIVFSGLDVKFSVQDVRLKDGIVALSWTLARFLYAEGWVRTFGAWKRLPFSGWVKQKELEAEANELITKGGKVYAAILLYEEASVLCGGNLPDYIPEGSTTRVIKIGDSPRCPCGGTHISDLSDIISMKVTQTRTKKGMTKVFYTIES